MSDDHHAHDEVAELRAELTACTRREAELREEVERLRGLLHDAMLCWDDTIEDMELNGLHDDPDFRYRTHKEDYRRIDAARAAMQGG